MMKMHRQNPDEDAAPIEAKVKIRKLDLTEKTCPAIQIQFKKFQQIRFGVPSFDVIVLHPLVHEFRIQSGAGDMDLALYDDDSPLVRWALETRKSLETCGESIGALNPHSAKTGQ